MQKLQWSALLLHDCLCPELLRFCQDDDVFEPTTQQVTASLPIAVAYIPAATTITTITQLALTSIDTSPALVSSTLAFIYYRYPPINFRLIPRSHCTLEPGRTVPHFMIKVLTQPNRAGSGPPMVGVPRWCSSVQL